MGCWGDAPDDEIMQIIISANYRCGLPCGRATIDGRCSQVSLRPGEGWAAHPGYADLSKVSDGAI